MLYESEINESEIFESKKRPFRGAWVANMLMGSAFTLHFFDGDVNTMQGLELRVGERI